MFVIPPNADNDVLAYFQERMPYGIAVPDVRAVFASVEPETALRTMRLTRFLR